MKDEYREVLVDGKVIGVITDDEAGKKWLRKVDGLSGIEIRPVTPESVRRYLGKLK